MNKLGELLVNQVKTNGWLSVSSVTFDNLSLFDVAQQGGFVGIDPANNVAVWASCEDTANTQVIENMVATQDNRQIGLMQTTVFQDLDCLQWWQAALLTFSHPFQHKINKTEDILDVKNKPLPIITYPKEADILSATYDPKTDKWNCKNVATALNIGLFGTRSVIPLYEESVNTLASALVDEWYLWYTRHKLFKDYIKTMYNLDII